MRQQKNIFDPLKNCILGHYSFLYKMNFSKKCYFLPKKCIFLTKMAIWPPGPRGPGLMSKNFFFHWYFSTKILKDLLEEGGGDGETPQWTFSIQPKRDHFWKIWKKKLPKVTGTLYIEWVLPKYIMIQCFWPNFLWKCPNFC